MVGTWALDPAVDYLNHGSFGATPIAVLEHQAALRAELEAQPMVFLGAIEARLDVARSAVAELVGADAEDLVFVGNATTAVNAVLRSLRFEAGDELLTIDHGYNACTNALHFVAERAGARVVTARIPFPIDDAAQAVESILSAVTPRTRLALIDHITSPTALVLPVETITRGLAERGVEVLIDGAHAPGMLELDLRRLAAAGMTYYTGNLHKWMCAPKSSAFLYVKRERQPDIRPLVISHGANAPARDRSRFLIEFDWMGTSDPTPHLCVPAAIEVLSGLVPGGLPALMKANRTAVLSARDHVAGRLGLSAPAPDSMIGSMAALILPSGSGGCDGPHVDPMQHEILAATGVQTVIMAWPAPPARVLRLSHQAYNRPEQFERLADALIARLR